MSDAYLYSIIFISNNFVLLVVFSVYQLYFRISHTESTSKLYETILQIKTIQLIIYLKFKEFCHYISYNHCVLLRGQNQYQIP